MFAYVGLGNALPHSSDRNGGGGDGVGTGSPQAGRRLGGHASITFGYQAKASGKDTGWAGAGAWIEGLPPVPPTPLLEGGGGGGTRKDVHKDRVAFFFGYATFCLKNKCVMVCKAAIQLLKKQQCR